MCRVNELYRTGRSDGRVVSTVGRDRQRTGAWTLELTREQVNSERLSGLAALALGLGLLLEMMI